MTINSNKFNGLDNEKYLKLVVSIFEDIGILAPSQMWIIKDASSTHQYASPSVVKLIGKDIDTWVGSTQIAGAFSEGLINKIISEEDDLILNAGQTIYVLKVYHIKDDHLFPCICIKEPLVNPNTKHIVGILCQLIELSLTNLSRQILNLYVDSEDNDGQLASIQLSKREKQVIFFFMHNLSSQQIVEVISKIEGKILSKSTIDSLFIDQLYIKFGVHSRVALADKLQKLGYATLIPESLLIENSIKLNKVSTY